jgi:hypothetical protein
MQLFHGDAGRSERASGKRTLAVQIDHDLVRELIRHCSAHGIDLTSAVAAAIASYLEQDGAEGRGAARSA